ncbi:MULTISPECIES: alanine/glycine:cation symporter family protein [unclassified Parvimonas]|uniref:alanine/glycine:cation symporter family protein n=1 Tax=unclassified Parvimonas TaxID=1151464 RepID=UPI00021D2EED|nr:amino acid carrier protein [Parvimonas sp. oral taxon 393 str. F0440]
MDSLISVLSKFANWLWGPPLMILLVGGGIFLTFRLGFFQIRYFPYIMKQTFGKMFSKNKSGEGTVSPFQAATAALASSIGAANIVVVPSIIFIAGPGSILWMWITAIVGQATKFGEIVLGILYRQKNEEGEFVGGACYYLQHGIGGKAGKILGSLVAFFFMIEILPSITLQTLAAAGPLGQLGIHKYIAIGFIFFLVILVVYGGIKRIGQVTEKLVPFMALIYLIFGVIVLAININKVPEAFKMIFVGAFNPTAIAGGATGWAVKKAITNGVARGVYSNESGMGSAPYAHSTAITDHPARQGMWGVFEVFVDTIVVCTMSALIVLTTGIWKNPEYKSIAVERAFNSIFGNIGSAVVSISLFLFVLSTIIVIVFYVEKLAEYLFGTKVGKIMRFVATIMIVLAAVLSFEHAGVFLDLTLGLVVIPNMIGIILMSGKIKKAKDEFFHTEGKFYLKDKAE